MRGRTRAMCQSRVGKARLGEMGSEGQAHAVLTIDRRGGKGGGCNSNVKINYVSILDLLLTS
jgi:hypothetical protein